MAVQSDGPSRPPTLTTPDTDRSDSAPPRVAGLWLALIAAPATFGVAAPAIVLPKMAAGYGLTLDVAGWLVTVAALSMAVGTPLAGGLISRRGVRTALLTSTVLLVVGTVVVAAVPWLPAALLGRSAQALGSTGLIAVAMNLAGTAGRMGLITSTIAACAAVGPLVGSLVTDWTSWLVVLLLPVVAALFVPPVLRHAPTAPADDSRFDGRFDGRGAALLTGLATALVVIPYFPLPAAICAAVAALLLALHIRARPDGFVPVALLRSPLFIGVSLLALLLATSFFRLLFVIPGQLADDAGWSEDTIGVGTLVSQVAGSVLAFAVAALAVRMGRTPVAVVLAAAGALAAVLAAVSASAVVVLAALAIALFSAAGGQGALMAFATGAVRSTERPVAIGLFNLSYQLGGALGPALAAMSVAS